MTNRRLFSSVAFGLLVLVTNGPSAHAITFSANATTSADWKCSNPHSARLQFMFVVTADNAEPAWFNEIIDWFTFAYKDCNFSPAHQVYQNFGSFQIRAGNSVSGSQTLVSTCPVQARNLVFANNRGYGPGTLSADITSNCIQPCALFLCRPDACDTIR